MAIRLGEYLKSLRKLNCFTLRQFEEFAGISNAYLSQIENNKIKSPSPNFLFKLADLYKVDYRAMFEKAGYIEESKQFTGPAFATIELGIKITKEEENKLMEYLEFLRTKKTK